MLAQAQLHLPLTGRLSDRAMIGVELDISVPRLDSAFSIRQPMALPPPPGIRK